MLFSFAGTLKFDKCSLWKYYTVVRGMWTRTENNYNGYFVGSFVSARRKMDVWIKNGAVAFKKLKIVIFAA